MGKAAGQDAEALAALLFLHPRGHDLALFGGAALVRNIPQEQQPRGVRAHFRADGNETHLEVRGDATNINHRS